MALPKDERLSDFAQRVGVSLSGLKKWLNGYSEPGLKNLILISNATGVSIDWLAKGEAPVHASDRPVRFPADIQAGEGRQSTPAPPGFVMVPRYNIEASAGPGALVAHEQAVDFLAFREDWVRRALCADPSRLALVTAVGDSMEPTIRAGDLLLVDTGVTDFIDDAIYVVAFNGHLVVKRIQRFFGGAVVIKSDNSAAYAEQTLSPEEAEEIHVAGRVRWIGRLI